MALSDVTIRTAKPKAHRYRLTDSHGLSIEVSPSSTPSEPKKYWRYRYKLGGKENIFAAGEWCQVPTGETPEQATDRQQGGRMTLAEAHQARVTWRAQVKSGHHPRLVRAARQLLASQSAASTFKAIAGEFVERRGGKWVLAVIGVAGALKLLKVLLPFRYRPLNDAELGLRLPFGADHASFNHFSAFPSGHTMLFFALCVPLWMRSRWLGAAAAVWTLLAICLPLLYLGYHWPSDIVAGAVVGVVLLLLLYRLIGATGLPDRVVRFSATHPPACYAIAWLVALEIAVRFGNAEAFSLDAARLVRALLF